MTMEPLLPENEPLRLAHLQAFQILDSMPETEYDDLVRIASEICRTPIALITLLDESRQWFKAKVGMTASETPRTDAFCNYAVQSSQLLVVPDAAADARFANNPLVTGEPHIRFYAGAPLLTSEGYALGTICVIDRTPRTLSDAQLASLQALSRQVVALLELRRSRRLLEAKHSELVQLGDQLRNRNDMLMQMQEAVIGMGIDLRIFLLNPAAEALYGISAADAVGLHLNEVLTAGYGDTNSREKALHEASVTSGWKREVYHIKRNGERLTVTVSVTLLKDEAGAASGYIAMVQDITERKRLEAALQESEQRFRLLIQDLHVGVLLQGANAEMLVCNPAALHLLGLTELQLLGRSSFDAEWNVIHEDGSLFPGETHPVPQAIQTRQPVRGVVMGVYRPAHKDRIWLLVDAEPQLTPSGEVQQVVCTFIDITERKAVEAEKERLSKQLQQSQKMESLGTLAGGIAHDFNNLLGGILGNISLLQSELATDALQQARLSRIEQAANRAADLTRRVLAFSRQGKLDVKPVSLNDCIRNVLALAEPALDKRITVYKALDLELPAVDGDSSQLEQLILNLTLNAADAIESASGAALAQGNSQMHRLEFQSAFELPKPEYAARYRMDITKRYVRLSVIDTGSGMTKEICERIFEPFFTTKPSGKGTGLGMAMVYGTVKNHHGYIIIDSEVGAGTAVHLYFPPSLLPAEPPIVPLSEKLPEGRGTVLVIDDEPLLQELTMEALIAAGYRVFQARNGKEGCEVFAAHRAEIRMVILDMNMPVMNGAETFKRLRELQPDLPVLLSTGYTDSRIANDLLRNGAAGLLAKPYSLETLIRQVASALKKPAG